MRTAPKIIWQNRCAGGNGDAIARKQTCFVAYRRTRIFDELCERASTEAEASETQDKKISNLSRVSKAIDEKEKQDSTSEKLHAYACYVDKRSSLEIRARNSRASWQQ